MTPSCILGSSRAGYKHRWKPALRSPWLCRAGHGALPALPAPPQVPSRGPSGHEKSPKKKNKKQQKALPAIIPHPAAQRHCPGADRLSEWMEIGAGCCLFKHKSWETSWKRGRWLSQGVLFLTLVNVHWPLPSLPQRCGWSLFFLG